MRASGYNAVCLGAARGTRASHDRELAWRHLRRVEAAWSRGEADPCELREACLSALRADAALERERRRRWGIEPREAVDE